jgi:hypothetical protein
MNISPHTNGARATRGQLNPMGFAHQEVATERQVFVTGV